MHLYSIFVFIIILMQILKLDHRSVVSEFICSCIDYLDEERRKLILSQVELEEEDDHDYPFEGLMHLGAPVCSLTSLATVEEENKSNHAFKHFLKKLIAFLRVFFRSYNLPLPAGTIELKLSAQDQVSRRLIFSVVHEV